MKAIAIKLLIWHTKNFIRKSTALKRKNIAFAESKKIGIIFSVNDLSKHEAIKHFVNLLEKDNKEVSVLAYLPPSTENFEFRFDYINIDSLSNLGHIKSESADKFIDTKFDFLFHMDVEKNNPIIENILSQSKASCRVGLYKEGKEALYELMLRHDSGKEIKGIVDEVYYYTKELN